MTKRIFRSISAVALAVFLVTFTLIMEAMYYYYESVQQQQLRVQTKMAVQGAELCGKEYFETLAVKDFRVTWIDSDGTVLYDSVSDSSAMENHLERQEVQEALKNGYGESSRYSDTLTERSLYAAQKLSDGTILRISAAHGSIVMLLIGMIRSIVFIIVIAFLLAFWLARGLSKRIVQPLNELDLEHPMENKKYDEIAPLLRRIDSQHKQLALQQTDLQRKQDELNTIIGSMEEGMVLLDHTQCILSINRSAAKLLGARENCIGANILTVSQDTALQSAVQQAAQGSAVSINTELCGKVFQISAAPVISEQVLSGIAIVFFDITERERAEQQRREFTANVSHELKTPLHAISGYSELLKYGIASEQDVRPFAEKIYNEAQRLIQLVEDIIKLSHLDEGAAEMQHVETDLYQLSEEVVKQLDTVATERQIEIQLEGDHAVILGIPELLHGIVYNLCDNAIKYNHTGGYVNISIADTADHAALTVKDTGIGIPHEHLDLIFQRFYRVDKSRSKAVGGTGLGLSIVKHAAKIHHADISIESEPGIGTEIKIIFPKCVQ